MPCIELPNNCTVYPVHAVPPITLMSGKPSDPRKWDSAVGIRLQSHTKFSELSENTRLMFSPQDFIWLELSIVPEIERVFVEKRGNTFEVLSVVNDRNPELRKRIFARERAIIDALPQHGFDFNILTRMNYDLRDLISDSEKPAYIRR